jgi:L-rhamnose isomerase / sugar isomerase
VRPALREWRRKKGLPENPLEALRESGYVERIERERRERNSMLSVSYA